MISFFVSIRHCSCCKKNKKTNENNKKDDLSIDNMTILSMEMKMNYKMETNNPVHFMKTKNNNNKKQG